MPFQLAYPDLLPETDTPDDADTYELGVRPGDILVMGTDGLFDNLWDDQLKAIVAAETRAAPRDAPTATRVAQALADTAHGNAVNRSFKSPWAVEAANAGVLPIFDRFFPRGGKLDDCTVVISFVVHAGSLQDGGA